MVAPLLRNISTFADPKPRARGVSRAGPGVHAVATSVWTGLTLLSALRPGVESAIRRLQEIASLPQGWDSYGSRPPTGHAVRAAMEVLAEVGDSALPEPVNVAPVSGGGVQLEWEQNGREFELEILPDGRAEALVIEDGEAVLEAVVDVTVVPTLLEWLVVGE